MEGDERMKLGFLKPFIPDFKSNYQNDHLINTILEPGRLVRTSLDPVLDLIKYHIKKTEQFFCSKP